MIHVLRKYKSQVNGADGGCRRSKYSDKQFVGCFDVIDISINIFKICLLIDSIEKESSAQTQEKHGQKCKTEPNKNKNHGNRCTKKHEGESKYPEI